MTKQGLSSNGLPVGQEVVYVSPVRSDYKLLVASTPDGIISAEVSTCADCETTIPKGDTFCTSCAKDAAGEEDQH